MTQILFTILFQNLSILREQAVFQGCARNAWSHVAQEQEKEPGELQLNAGRDQDLIERTGDQNYLDPYLYIKDVNIVEI